MTKKSEIVAIIDTLDAKFDITQAKNDNFRIQLPPAEMSRLKTEQQWRAFLELAEALRAQGLNADINSAFKGNDGKWVNYPSLWVNQSVKSVDTDVIKQAVAAGIAAYEAAKGAKVTVEVAPPAEPVY